MKFRARILLTVFLASLLPIAQAHAHAILIDSQPAVSASVAAGQVAFKLHYNSRIDRARSRVSLVHAGAPDMTLKLGVDDVADLLTADATLEPGAYTLRWQVLAIDGHITRGDLPFTVAPSGK
jgi:methionine-rich copper-binding protein CopC